MSVTFVTVKENARFAVDVRENCNLYVVGEKIIERLAVRALPGR
jgi:hypothetical protein